MSLLLLLDSVKTVIVAADDRDRRGMAAYVGRDVAKLKAKGGGKWKYMSEKDMIDVAAKFSPYRYVLSRPARRRHFKENRPSALESLANIVV